MQLIRTFNELGKGDAGIAGGKGASLGEMTQAGIPVPPGFVILADAFERFIEETGLVKKIEDVLETVDTDAMSTVEVASQKIQDLILTAEMPADIAGEVEKNFKVLGAEHVAVRSSATAEDSASAAWAGQLDSYLNTTHEELLRNVQRCWASLFTPRAIFYRFEKKLHLTKISVAVVVQTMVHSEVSGIAFSVHPVTEDRNQLIIEAGYGLGEAIVSGQVTPDSYVVEKAPRKISEINVSTQSRGLYRAEKGGNEWQIIQEPKASAQTLTHEQIDELAHIVVRIEMHYGFPCDIEWAFAEGKFYIVQSRPITTLSAETEKAARIFKADKVSGVGGSIFALSSLLEVICQSNVQHTFKFPFYALSINDAEQKADEWIDEAAYGSVVETILTHVENNGVSYFEQTRDKVVAQADQIHRLAGEVTAGLPTLSDAELVQSYTDFMQTYTRFFGTGAVSFLYEGMISDFLSESLKIKYENATDEIAALLKSPYRSFMFDNEDRLFAIKQEKDQHAQEALIAAYKKEFFYINSGFSYTRPLDTETVLSLAKEASVHTAHAEALATMLVLTKGEQNIISLLRVTEAIRDQRKRTNYIGNFVMFRFLDEACRRNKYPVSIVQKMFWTEFADSITQPNELIHKLEQRTIGSVVLEQGQTYYLEYDALSPRVALDASVTECKGTPACRGLVKGPANIILTTADFAKFKEGDVLITEMTRPEFVPLMKKASAIVTDEGGLTCHAAIVSRELNKPCVIGTKIASQIFKDGEMVEVDADNGVVRIVQRINGIPSYIKNKDDYFLQGKWAAPTLAWSVWTMWAHSPKARELGFKRAGSQYLILNPASFLEKDGLNTEVYDTVYGELVQGKSSTAEKLFAHAKEIEDEIAAHTATIRTDPSSEENLVKALLLYERGVFPAMTTDHMGNAAEKLIEDTIAKQGLDSAAVYSNIRDLKSLPLYDFDVQRELKEALEALGLGRDVTYTEVEQRDPALAARIQAHQQETEYMGTHNVQGSPRTMDKFLHGLFDVAPAFSVAPMAVEMPASLQAALKVAEQAIYWRTQMGEVMTRMMYATKPAMENLAKKFDMTFEELTYATHLEIIDAVTNGAAIDKTQCLARMQNYGLVAPADERRVDVFVGATFDALQEKFGLKTVVEMAGEIQGKTAYKGKARGRAVVLMRASDGDQLLPGDILVAAETTPDYILAMNRAAAFVTDRGGITSHAAIIAREMRKPCIIATKVGTQVLKTGDMVEVDADHGVVRKIS